MSSVRLMIFTLVMTLSALLVAGCASNESDNTDMMVIQQQQPQRQFQPQSQAAPAVADNATDYYKSRGAVMRHSIRQLAEYDVGKMLRLLRKEVNMQEQDENVFLDEAAESLGQTVFLQPDFNAREAALRELKGLLEPEQYPLVLEKAADGLLEVMRSSTAPSDQAGALLALTNLVVEVRALKKPELKSVLQKIADADLKVTAEAKKYAVEPMEGLISPSLEAQSALKTL